MIPIVAYNYGAKNRERIVKTVKLSVAIAIGIMILGVLVFQIFPSELLAIFNASDEMQRIGVPALRIISLSFVFAGFCIIVTSVFQALGNGIYSMIISFVRQIIVILPVSYLLATFIDLHALWFAFPIAEIFSLFMSFIMLKSIYQKKLKNL